MSTIVRADGGEVGNEDRLACGLPPLERTIVPPDGGWKRQTYYVVDVAIDKNNCVHRSIFYSGFLNGRDGGPGGYNAIMNPTYERMYDNDPYSKWHYIKVIRELGDRKLNEVPA